MPIFLIKKRKNTFLYLGNISIFFSLISSILIIKLKRHILIFGNHMFFVEHFLFKLDKNIRYPFGTRFGILISKLLLKMKILTQDQIRIHALNPVQYRIYKKLGFKNVYLIPNFIETFKIKNIKENLNEFLVCYISRIDPKHKGIDILIEVIKKALEKNKNIKFYIAGIGDKEFEKQLKELEKNYSNNVKYLGRISEEEKYELLSKSSIFVLPSRWEGLPIAVLEATSEGNICLLSNIPAHKYILNLENKFGFICKNVEDYVNKILELYDFWKNNKKEFLEWRKYIQKRAIELYSLEKIVKEFEEKLLN